MHCSITKALAGILSKLTPWINRRVSILSNSAGFGCSVSRNREYKEMSSVVAPLSSKISIREHFMAAKGCLGAGFFSSSFVFRLRPISKKVRAVPQPWKKRSGVGSTTEGTERATVWDSLILTQWNKVTSAAYEPVNESSRVRYAGVCNFGQYILCILGLSSERRTDHANGAGRVELSRTRPNPPHD